MNWNNIQRCVLLIKKNQMENEEEVLTKMNISLIRQFRIMTLEKFVNNSIK